MASTAIPGSDEIDGLPFGVDLFQVDLNAKF